mmetsp:Transcript_59789/g.140895  ORF Transcript_59789/g.140895 Transcript_59789/m.140895 type:complete len:385 (+) Transcript_59789:543-1697(+)
MLAHLLVVDAVLGQQIAHARFVVLGARRRSVFQRPHFPLPVVHADFSHPALHSDFGIHLAGNLAVGLGHDLADLRLFDARRVELDALDLALPRGPAEIGEEAVERLWLALRARGLAAGGAPGRLDHRRLPRLLGLLQRRLGATPLDQGLGRAHAAAHLHVPAVAAHAAAHARPAGVDVQEVQHHHVVGLDHPLAVRGPDGLAQKLLLARLDLDRLVPARAHPVLVRDEPPQHRERQLLRRDVAIAVDVHRVKGVSKHIQGLIPVKPLIGIAVVTRRFQEVHVAGHRRRKAPNGKVTPDLGREIPKVVHDPALDAVFLHAEKLSALHLGPRNHQEATNLGEEFHDVTTASYHHEVDGPTHVCVLFQDQRYHGQESGNASRRNRNA